MRNATLADKMKMLLQIPEGWKPAYRDDLRGLMPESCACIDCGVNTAPGLVNRAEAEKRHHEGTMRNPNVRI